MRVVRTRIAILLSVWLLAALPGGVVPWPAGNPPTPTHLRALLAEAVRVGGRERLDQERATQDPGEEAEATQVSQTWINEGQVKLDKLFLFGDEYFAHEFQASSGYGGLIPGPGLRRVHQGVAGARDTYACMGCHTVGGLDGAGGPTQTVMLYGDGQHATSANLRNPPSLLGVGLLQAIAAEMSAILLAQQADALQQAARDQQPITVALQAKGVSYGQLVAYPDGHVDTAQLSGISADLIVRPFGWKGDEARLRRMVEEASRVHFGAQSHPMVLRHHQTPDVARMGSGPSDWDPDQDGMGREIEEGAITATAVYLALLETPEILPPSSPALQQRWAEGDRIFSQLGCDTCHVRALHIDTPIWDERPDSAGPPVVIHLLQDGEQPRGTDRVMAFTDLKRHDMGPALADPHPHPLGIPQAQFLTRPLWGLAETAPYLHDGRAPTIPAAILAHGGEAQAARDAFAALTPSEQASLHVFLLSLSRHPKPRVAR